MVETDLDEVVSVLASHTELDGATVEKVPLIVGGDPGEFSVRITTSDGNEYEFSDLHSFRCWVATLKSIPEASA